MRIKTLDKKTLRIDRRPELYSLCLAITVAVSLKISLETQQLNLRDIFMKIAEDISVLPAWVKVLWFVQFHMTLSNYKRKQNVFTYWTFGHTQKGNKNHRVGSVKNFKEFIVYLIDYINYP